MILCALAVKIYCKSVKMKVIGIQYSGIPLWII
jgi:hypothetical protein